MGSKFKKYQTIYDDVKRENPEDRKAIGAALLKRMMSDVKVIGPFEEERSSVLQAHNSGFLPIDEWKAFLKANEYIHIELQEVKEEASRLKEGWGETIITQAVQLVATNNQKKTEAEYLQKQETKRKKEEKQKEKKKILEYKEMEKKKILDDLDYQRKMEKQEQKANKMASELLQQEENRKKKK